MNTRRQFLIRAPLGFLVEAAACHSDAPAPATQSTPVTPGAPPTFGTGVGSGPDVTPHGITARAHISFAEDVCNFYRSKSVP
jgi:hypothetical protein